MNNFHRDQVSGQGRAVSVGVASEMLGVSCQTVRNWIQAGVLKASRTFGNHRRISVRSIKRWNGEDEEPQEERQTICYARVSTQAQKKEGNLNRQENRLVEYCENEFQNSRENILVISESGSGLNESRRGYLKLINLILGGKIERILVEHRDRIARYGVRLFEVLCERHSVELIVTNTKDEVSDEIEMASDIMSLVTVYAARSHGARGGLAKKMIVTDEAKSLILELHQQGVAQKDIPAKLNGFTCPKTLKPYSIHSVRETIHEQDRLQRIIPSLTSPIQQFVDQFCVREAGARCYSKPFHKYYSSWAESQNLPAPSSRSLTTSVKRLLNIPVQRNGSGYFYFVGLKLKGNERSSRSHLA